MKKFGKILFAIFIIFLTLGLATYVDYYIVKRKNTTPKIAIKKDINENLVVYNAFMYRLWYCKSNGKYTLGDYKDSDAICFPKNSYDSDGNYINNEGVLITKEKLELINEYYNQDEISKMNEEEINNIILVITEYGKTKYKVLENEETIEIKNKLGYDIVIFPEYKLEDNNYNLKYDETKYYCSNENEFSLYENEECNNFNKLTLNEDICLLYRNGVLKDKLNLDEFCEE